MSFKKSANSAGPRVWTVAEFGAFYTTHRRELLTHANRVLKDSTKAEEITQDALIKFMLAAPELESTEHALSYLHRTIENLCIDLFRLEGRRPNLVLLDDATAEIEAVWQDNGDHSAAMSAAEDAAIIRQALALLSPAERAALVMWEMEGRSTEEIAAELGIKESAVRHTVSRARASLRKVLSTLIVDQERGLTALDALSSTYKKAVVLAQKSSKAVLSLLLLTIAFLGFNSMGGNEGVLPLAIQNEISADPLTGSTDSPLAPSTDSAPAPTSVNPSPSPTSAATVAAQAAAKKALLAGANIKVTRLAFAGLDKEGLPTGFTITDSSNAIGTIRLTRSTPILTSAGVTVSNVALTAQAGPNVMLAQKIIIDGAGTRYEVASVFIGMDGIWTPLILGNTTFEIERISSGQFLLTSTIPLTFTPTSELYIATGKRGYDLTQVPTSITTRLLLNSGKTIILAQAISVNTPNSTGGNA